MEAGSTGCLPREGGLAVQACVRGRGWEQVQRPGAHVLGAGSTEPLSEMDSLSSRPVTSSWSKPRGDTGGPSAGGSTLGHSSWQGPCHPRPSHGAGSVTVGGRAGLSSSRVCGAAAQDQSRRDSGEPRELPSRQSGRSMQKQNQGHLLRLHSR